MFGLGDNFLILLGVLGAVFVVISVVFFLLREFWCWYFKINNIVALLEEQNKYLALLAKAARAKIPAKDDAEKQGIEKQETEDLSPSY